MKTKQVHLALKRVVNLGSYESFHAEVGMTVEVGDGETWTDKDYDNLSDQVREYVESELSAGLRARGG